MTYCFNWQDGGYAEPYSFYCGEWRYLLKEDLPDDLELDLSESIVWNNKSYYRCGGGLIIEGTSEKPVGKIIITDYYSNQK